MQARTKVSMQTRPWKEKCHSAYRLSRVPFIHYPAAKRESMCTYAITYVSREFDVCNYEEEKVMNLELFAEYIRINTLVVPLNLGELGN